MRKSFKFKLYKSPKREKLLRKQVRVAAAIYNHFLALNKRYFKIYKKSLSLYQAQKHLTKLKKLEKYSWMKQLGSQAAQEVLERIDKGYKKFFQDLKSGVSTSPPKFKASRKYKSFTLKQAGYSLLGGNRIKIGKKVFKFSKSREIEGDIKTLTVKRDSVGDWFLVFSCELEDSIQKSNYKSGKIAGFDFGLKNFLTDHNGKLEPAPEPFRKSLKKLKKLSRKLSKKKRNSNNRRRARVGLARLHRKIANQRHDFHFWLARKLVSKYDVIFLEDLNLKGMSKLFGRKVSDLGFSDFVRILEYQCLKYGALLHKVDRFYPSSQTCSNCLKIKEPKLELWEREWECVECGAVHDRDHNAAKNILREGASSLGLCGVKTELRSAASNSRIPLLQ